MVRRLLVTAVMTGTAFAAAGCNHKKCCNGSTTRPPQPYYPSGPGTIPAPGVPTSPYGAPGGVVPSVGPATGPVVPAIPPGRPTDLPPPSIELPRGSNLGPSVAPPKPAREELLPEPLPGTGPMRSQYPAAPRPADGVLGGPVGPGKGQTAEPPVAARPPAVSSADPVGLPGFVRIKDGVAGGRKPTLDGFDWLKQAGYRTVVVLHGPGTDLSTDRELAAKKGLTFVGIETTPETLGEALAKLNQSAADRSSKPMYVYDDANGLRAGAAWYLHFRTAEEMAPDSARIRAGALGLPSPDQSEEAKAYWVAINDHLAKR